MTIANRKIQTEPGVIRQLDTAAANRIAAGEVVERPASAVKELVENALDAGATQISVSYADGGKSHIQVTDNGHGIAATQLALAMARHATSKIDGTNLSNINTFGFRGEALPSLAAVSRLSITSRLDGTKEAAQIAVTAGKSTLVRPAALNGGTQVEIRDLFFATPARLKFLHSDRAEAMAINDTVKRLAMAEPLVGFHLQDITDRQSPRQILRTDAHNGDLFDALFVRLRQILGADFTQNALTISAQREGFSLSGYASLPTYSRGSTLSQYLFVNGRPVRDKLLAGALRGAYSDFLHRDRFPVCALFVECDPHLIDVNVHPAKAEVRFRDPGIVRGMVVSGLRHALAEAGHRASSTVAQATLGAFRPEQHPQNPVYQMDRASPRLRAAAYQAQQPGFAETTAYSGRIEDAETPPPEIETLPLGAARAQLHENYIVAQTPDGLIIVDQHAAHERLVYERLKRATRENGIEAQALLIPEIIQLSEDEATRVLAIKTELAHLGLTIEPFGGNAVCIRETPAILGEVDVKNLILDICDELADFNQSQGVKDKIEAILSRIACHGSIRSGRRMRAEEMNALLREMETTPYSGQCNHGRPTYVELKLTDIEKLFGRR